MSIIMDELGACLSTYVLLMFDAIYVWYYYFVIYVVVIYVVMMDEAMEFVLIKFPKLKKALVCICLVCEQYLCYVQNVVWISNLHATFVQANPQGS